MVKDKIFLLSFEEAKRYLANGEFSLFKCEGSKCFWWLRSPGVDKTHAVCINYYDFIHQYGHHISIQSDGIRPALHINPNYLQTLDKKGQEFVLFAGREWLILNEENGLLLSKDVLNFHTFDRNHNVYENSEIRDYLNNKLINDLFTAEEQEMIVDTVIDGETSYPAA